MAKTPRIVTLAQFLKMKGKQKSPVIIHFDRKQWANLTRGLKPENGPAPKGASLALSTLPGIDGGFVEANCPFITQIDPLDENQLRCGDAPEIPKAPDQEIDPVRAFCALIVRKNGSIVCTGTCRRTGQRCQLSTRTVRIPGSQVLYTSVSCGCGN